MKLEHGIGVEQDLEEAVRWYRAAAAQGDNSAEAALGRLGIEP
ncbi:MAG: SEL1-like repeat protein [Candidatus Binatia bacterium]|nr:SEL1-like repeat protein [Candidatus Binatia bacterium]